MLARLRRKIQQVHYYSARRRHTIWSRLASWSMVTSLAGAMAAVLVAEQVVLRTTVLRSLRGGLAQLDSGGLLALDRTPVGEHTEGLFIAVHDDGNIAA